MANSKKPETSRLNVFYILQTLALHTDRDHPLTVEELTQKVNAEFTCSAAGAPVHISKDTVKRTLEDLLYHVFPAGMEDNRTLMHSYGCYLYAVMEEQGAFAAYREPEKKPFPKKYYYLERDLKPAEILTLKDAIETHSYFSEEDITELVQKLLNLCPRAFDTQYFDVAEEERYEDSLLLSNIDELNRLIRERKCAQIVYCAYDLQKELKPRPGYPKVLEPVRLMWSNGYYYLLSYYPIRQSDGKYEFIYKEENIISLRVDRITTIEPYEQAACHPAALINPVQYRQKHPIMYRGKKSRIELLWRDTGKNYFMNTIMDVFGKAAKVRPAAEELIVSALHHNAAFYKKQGITWYQVTVESTEEGILLWATQYCDDCVVISPEKLVERIRGRLKKGMEYYGIETERSCDFSG